jgi:hypothetical protein
MSIIRPIRTEANPSRRAWTPTLPPRVMHLEKPTCRGAGGSLSRGGRPGSALIRRGRRSWLHLSCLRPRRRGQRRGDHVMRRPVGSDDGRFPAGKSFCDRNLGDLAPVCRRDFQGPSSNASRRERLPVQPPIVPDRLRKVPTPSTLAKCLSPLDLFKMTVSLTVSSAETCQNALRDKDLADQLMIEWE